MEQDEQITSPQRILHRIGDREGIEQEGSGLLDWITHKRNDRMEQENLLDFSS